MTASANGRPRPTTTTARPTGTGHGWMMPVCCIPMVVLAVALVAAGVVDVGFLVFAGVCVGMMALMMRGMDHTDHPDDGAGRPAVPPQHADDPPPSQRR
ncbi:hypothetical protein [Euzebya pacifica]|uniref:hypothetical protein n=1 Tax=Euzebya pacifica TaxID=1608957 RepID=UPI0030FC37C4